MTGEAARADRLSEVRRAARAWARAQLITDEARARIVELYADDRRRLPLGLAILAGAATFLGGQALLVATFMIARPESTVMATLLLALFSAACVVATEYQRGRLRRVGTGVDLATAWLAALLACAATHVGAREHVDALVLLAVDAAIFAAGAYRWGLASQAAAATLVTLVALARLPLGRAWWIAGCLALLALAIPRRHAERLPPAHRRCLRVVWGVSLLALYLAIHYDGVKGGLIESIGDEAAGWGRGAFTAAAVLTALLPIATLAFGIRRRDKLAIAIGALLAGVSLATWRVHWPWAPLWLTLTLGGAACFVTAVLVRRFLDRSPGREWRGITAEPLLDDPAHAAALRVAAVAATLGHAPQAASGDRPFQAGGGVSGGGGADGRI